MVYEAHAAEQTQFRWLNSIKSQAEDPGRKPGGESLQREEELCWGDGLWL